MSYSYHVIFESYPVISCHIHITLCDIMSYSVISSHIHIISCHIKWYHVMFISYHVISSRFMSCHTCIMLYHVIECYILSFLAIPTLNIHKPCCKVSVPNQGTYLGGAKIVVPTNDLNTICKVDIPKWSELFSNVLLYRWIPLLGYSLYFLSPFICQPPNTSPTQRLPQHRPAWLKAAMNLWS